MDTPSNNPPRRSLSERAREDQPKPSTGLPTPPAQNIGGTKSSAPMGEWRQRRWYDREPQASKAIRCLLAFPVVFQDVVCQTLLNLAAQLPQNTLDPLKSVGTENILALYKAKQKRRDYDQRELTHDTLSQLGVLPETKRNTMMRHINQLTEAFRGYLKLCKQYQAKPNLVDVRKLLNQYQMTGPEGCTSVLQNIHDEWEQVAQIKNSNLAFMHTPRPPLPVTGSKAKPTGAQNDNPA